MNEEVSLAMGEYREIITKAVVAKGRKFTQSNHTICPAHRADKHSWLLDY